MGHAAQVALISDRLSGIESLVWAEADRAKWGRSFLVHAADVYLRPVAPVVVETTDGLPVILRGAGTEVRRARDSNLTERWKVPRQRSERASRRQAKILQRVSHSVDRTVD